MPTLSFDATKAAVVITTSNDDWPDPTDRVTIQRQTPSGAWETIPGYEAYAAVGSRVLATDIEMPLDVTVTYRALNRAGVPSPTASISTAGAEWGMWVKVRRDASLTVRLNWSDMGESRQDALGGFYQVHGGRAVAQYTGVAPEELDVQAWVDTREDYLAIRRLLSTDRRVFIQMPSPKEMDDGWWWVNRVSWVNLNQRTFEAGGEIRMCTLSLRQIDAPRGAIGKGIGATYGSVAATWADYLDLYNNNSTYWDLLDQS